MDDHEETGLSFAGERVTASPEEIDLDVLDITLSFFLRSLSLAVSRDWEARLDDLHVIRGTGKVTALFLIARHPGIRPSVIAQVSQKNRSEMGRILDELEANGLLCRRTNSQDLRARALFLTEEGERIVTMLRERVRESRAFFDDISEEDYTQTLALLRTLYWRIVTKPRPFGKAGA